MDCCSAIVHAVNNTFKPTSQREACHDPLWKAVRNGPKMNCYAAVMFGLFSSKCLLCIDFPGGGDAEASCVVLSYWV